MNPLLLLLPLLPLLTSALPAPPAPTTVYHNYKSTFARPSTRAPTAADAAAQLLAEQFPALTFEPLPGAYRDPDTGMWHVYFRQTDGAAAVHGAFANVNVWPDPEAGGWKVWSWGERVVRGAAGAGGGEAAGRERRGVARGRKGDGEKGTYTVLKFGGAESPSAGERTVETGVLVETASPGGWHDGTSTTGPNVDAYYNPGAGQPLYRPDGGAERVFEFAYDPAAGRAANRDAAVVQAFYMVNSLHDYFEELGVRDGLNYEPVNVEVQSHGAEVVGRALWEDGATPTLRLGTTNVTVAGAANQFRDAAFDATVLINGWARSVTHRLVGGLSHAPGSCLALSAEGADLDGGLADFYALALTLPPDATAATPRHIGAWLHNRPDGIRPLAYAADRSFPYTFADLDELPADSPVHAQLLANTLYTLMWSFLPKKGNVAEMRPQWQNAMRVKVPVGGRNYVVRLVTEALKMMPCGGGWLELRDAIVDVEYSWTAGQNLCEIWRAWAWAGMGVGAAWEDGKRVASFQLIPEC